LVVLQQALRPKCIAKPLVANFNEHEVCRSELLTNAQFLHVYLFKMLLQYIHGSN